MGLSRRKFIQIGAVAAVGTGIPLHTVAKTSQSSLTAMASSLLGLNATPTLNMAAFKAHLNTVFTVSNKKGDVSNITLASVYDWGRRRKNRTKECFSLIFSDSTRPLTQDTYSVTHPSLGSFSMLLVPSGRNRRARKYEAVFNRLI